MEKLKATLRKEKGKIELKKLRKKGNLPAILYGKEIGNILLSVNEKEIKKIYDKLKKNETILLEISPNKTYEVFIKKIQEDPINEEILHIDFFKPEKK